MFKEFLERFCKLEGLDLVVDSPSPPATNFFVGVIREYKTSNPEIYVDPSFGWIQSPKLVTTMVSGNSVEEACKKYVLELVLDPTRTAVSVIDPLDYPRGSVEALLVF